MLLERERREQVLAHDPVLELGGFVQHVDERLAMLDHEGRLGLGTSASGCQHRGETALGGRAGWLNRVGHITTPPAFESWQRASSSGSARASSSRMAGKC